MTFSVGENVGAYRILEKLGQGGMATVYKAYHAGLDRYVALKVLHPAFLEDPNFQARFQREARLVAKMEHVNIVPVYDFAEHERRPYLVMKFIEGETLKARLTRGSLPESEIGSIIEAVGSALSYAHKQGVLHRDIKPSNVLLATDGQIYLADFGLARIAQSGESTLSTDMIMGTPQYISPEQAMGKKELDEGTDIYSFGVMAYELIVGKVPFSADTPFSIIHDHIYSLLPLPRKIKPEISIEVERVLLKALSKERNDRYKDVSSMVEAFRQTWADRVPAGLKEAENKRIKKSAKATATVRRDQETDSPPMEEATKAVVGVLPQTDLTIKTKSSGKAAKKMPWMWISVSVLLFLCCLVTFSALRSAQRQGGLLGLGRSAAQTATAIGEIVSTAQQRVTQSPDDPNVYLDLTIAYFKAGMIDDAQNILTETEIIAGENQGFYWDACERLNEIGAWLLASQMCVHAAQITPANDSLTSESVELLHEVIYKASIEPEAPNVVAFDTLADIDAPLSDIARARHTFFNVDQAQGQQILDELNQRKPNMPESLLLQAEFEIKRGEFDVARQTINQLMNQPQTLDWMRESAQKMLQELP